MTQANAGTQGRTVQGIVEAANGRLQDAFLRAVTPKLDEVAEKCLRQVRTTYSSSPRLAELSAREAGLSDDQTRLTSRLGLLNPLLDSFSDLSFESVDGNPFSQPCGIEEIDDHIRVLNIWRGVYSRDSEAAREVQTLLSEIEVKFANLKEDISRLESEIKALETPSLAAKLASFLSSKPKVEDTAVSTGEENELVSQSVIISSGLCEVVGRVDVASAKYKRDALTSKQTEIRDADAFLTEVRAKLDALSGHLNQVNEHIGVKVQLIKELPQTLLDAANTELTDVANQLSVVRTDIETEVDRLCNIAEVRISEIIGNFQAAGEKVATRLHALANDESPK